jgi:hypothetical protein
MSKVQGQHVKRGDPCIPRPADVKTRGERSNIVGTCPENAREFEENFRHRLSSRDGAEDGRGEKD